LHKKILVILSLLQNRMALLGFLENPYDLPF
jgi:hypothetical protein